MQLRDFRGFRFGKVHSSDLNLEVVNSSGYYEARTLPNPNDQVTDIPGADGQYYFGSVYKNREITVNVAFDSVTEEIYRKIRQLFSTDKLQDLVFDEEPYKTWKAKLKSKPDFKSICFIDKETGQRVYKGDGKLSFICYYPYAFGFNKYIVTAADYYILTPPESIIKAQQQENFDNVFIAEDKTKSDKILIDEKYCYNMELTEDKWKDIRFHYNTNPDNVRNNIAENRDELHSNKMYDYSPNDGIKWSGGFPTKEQIERGELYYDVTDEYGTKRKTILDVKGYWDNIPKWQSTAKLLTTPTLDYEQELIFMPQYSKSNYVNMELGFDKNRPMIGARLLVYNPGDIPINWELKIDEKKRGFWSSRNGDRLRISRYNVERLPIPHAVDWCGLTTYNKNDDREYKYGNKYFVRKSFDKEKVNSSLETFFDNPENSIRMPDGTASYDITTAKEHFKNGFLPADKKWEGLPKSYPYETDTIDTKWYEYDDIGEYPRRTQIPFNLHLPDIFKDRNGDGNYEVTDIIKTEALNNNIHPHHCYYVEPIPREKLGHYIKLFYWQTILWRGNKIADAADATVQWGELLDSDLFEKKDNKYYIKDSDNPVINLVKMFVNIGCEYDVINEEAKCFIPFGAELDKTFPKLYENLKYEDGVKLADEYEELYQECSTDLERYELYWETLRKLLKNFSSMLSITDSNANIDDFINDFINQPWEYITLEGKDLNYNSTFFNGYSLPTWMPSDYIEIDVQDLSNAQILNEYLAVLNGDDNGNNFYSGQNYQYTEENRNILLAQGKSKLADKMDKIVGINGYLNSVLDDNFVFDSEKQMIYTMENEYGLQFDYTPKKVVYNEAIKKGQWFKLPPGWSLIAIEPIIDKTNSDEENWRDAHVFDNGYGGCVENLTREVQQLYDFIEKYVVRKEFYKFYSQDQIPVSNEDIDSESDYFVFKNWYSQELLQFSTIQELKDEVINKVHYNEYTGPIYSNNYYYQDSSDLNKGNLNYFKYCYYKRKKEIAEYTYFNILYEAWQIISPYYTWTQSKGAYYDLSYKPHEIRDYDDKGMPLRCINGQIDDWWFYGRNFYWGDFPPPYWVLADSIHEMKIKYTPLYN